MNDKMTHWERIRATLSGQEFDRPAVSMWRHFYRGETSATGLAEAMLGFQGQYDWDFMKVNPRASYHVEGWGVEFKYKGDNEPQITRQPIQEPDDWLRPAVLPLERGVLKEQLDALELIALGLKGQVPFLMTVFTPLAVAARLAPSEDLFLQHLREYPDKVKHTLEVVTETFVRFAAACLERGASGLFYATSAWASSLRLTEAEYRGLARPYDFKLLRGLPTAEFHILHVCRAHNFLDQMNDYPVQAFNWDARAEGNLGLCPGSRLVGGKTVIGGIPQGEDLVVASPPQLMAEVTGLRVAMGNRGWMLGTGCTFVPGSPASNLTAIRAAAAKELV